MGVEVVQVYIWTQSSSQFMLFSLPEALPASFHKGGLSVGSRLPLKILSWAALYLLIYHNIPFVFFIVLITPHICVCLVVYFQSLLLDYKLPQGIFYIFLVHYYTKASILCRISQAIRKCYVNEWLHE